MSRGEENLELELKKLRPAIGRAVGKRIAELRANNDLHSELCFCLLTANYTAEGGIRIQERAGDFSEMSLSQLRSFLKRCGHRFPNARASYIYDSKKHKGKLNCLSGMAGSAARREWLVHTVRGLGYKEASHFLRNIGYMDVAIIDRHIINLLAEHGIIKKPKTLTKKRYLAIEKKLGRIAKRMGMSLGELDFYLWYMKTGKVLK